MWTAERWRVSGWSCCEGDDEGCRVVVVRKRQGVEMEGYERRRRESRRRVFFIFSILLLYPSRESLRRSINVVPFFFFFPTREKASVGDQVTSFFYFLFSFLREND